MRLMVLELAVGASLVAAAAYALRAMRRHNESLPEGPEGDELPTGPKGPRGLRVGDVLLYADTELWLAGCIEVDEEGLVCRAFRTPGSPRSTWLLQLDEEAHDLALADLTDEVPGGSIPESLPIGGMRLRLKRRGKGEIHTSGDQLPSTTAEAGYTFLEGPGGRLLLVLDFEGGERLSLRAERIGREMLELLPGGDDDAPPN